MADQKNIKKKNGEPKDEIFEAPVLQREPSAKQVTLGGRLTLRVTATGRPLPAYQWFLNGKKISGATMDRYMVNKVRREHMGNYHCEVKNYMGKVVSRPAMVSVIIERIPPIVIEPGAASIPLGKPFKFQITSVPPERLKKLNIQWTFNGKRINGAKGPELEFLEVKKKYEGDYKVILTVGGELRSSNKVTLKVAGAEGKAEEIPVGDLSPASNPLDDDFFFNPEDELDDAPTPAPDLGFNPLAEALSSEELGRLGLNVSEAVVNPNEKLDFDPALQQRLDPAAAAATPEFIDDPSLAPNETAEAAPAELGLDLFPAPASATEMDPLLAVTPIDPSEFTNPALDLGLGLGLVAPAPEEATFDAPLSLGMPEPAPEPAAEAPNLGQVLELPTPAPKSGIARRKELLEKMLAGVQAFRADRAESKRAA